MARVVDFDRIKELAVVDALGRAWCRAAVAGHERQTARALRPDALIIRGIDTAAGEVGEECGLAGIIESHLDEETVVVHTLGRPRGGVPAAGHKAQVARALRPYAPVVRIVDAAAG